jgi:PST family polysaccharide transporter/lipopolysaccharide exporter
MLSASFAGFVPRLTFSIPIARELFQFGKYMWALGALTAISSAVDRAIVGRLFGANSLGVYHNANTLARLPTDQITHLVNAVAFPSLAKIQEDTAAMRHALTRSMSLVCMLTMPVVAGLIALANDVVLAVLGDQWIGAAPILQVLCVRGLILSVTALSGPVFQAIGKPQVLPATSFVEQMILLACIYGLAGFGAIGIAWATVIPVMCSGLIAFFLLTRMLRFTWANLLVPIVRPVVPTAIMVSIVAGISEQFFPQYIVEPTIRVAVLVPTGITAYAIASLTFNRYEFLHACRTLTRLLKGT